MPTFLSMSLNHIENSTKTRQFVSTCRDDWKAKKKQKKFVSVCIEYKAYRSRAVKCVTETLIFK